MLIWGYFGFSHAPHLLPEIFRNLFWLQRNYFFSQKRKKESKVRLQTQLPPCLPLALLVMMEKGMHQNQDDSPIRLARGYLPRGRKLAEIKRTPHNTKRGEQHPIQLMPKIQIFLCYIKLNPMLNIRVQEPSIISLHQNQSLNCPSVHQ